MNDFYNEMLDQSVIKATIVEKYFSAWSKIMKNHSTSYNLGYLDLFSGPGKYKNGDESTPIKIIKQCIKDKYLRERMVIIFNDFNKSYVESLKKEISMINGIELLKNKPIVNNFEINDDIAEELSRSEMIPCISFVDPWGYKGISKKLLKALIKDWGSDCIFFFNYNRINAGITNPLVKKEIDSIFGEEISNEIKQNIRNFNSNEREQYIINELSKTLSENGRYFFIPFQFINSKRNRTSHYIIFLTKNKTGYKIMKDIMSKFSSEVIQGVGSFSYVPTQNKQLTFLYAYSQPINILGTELLRTFSNRTLTVKQIYEEHNIGTNYTLANYKEALRKLEATKKILCIPSVRKKRNGIKTMADRVKVSFPMY